MANYQIVGGDGKEYGPISAEGVTNWLQEGRANGDTRIREVGAEQWQSISDLPEFANAFSATVSPPPAEQFPRQPVAGQFPQQKPGKIQAIAIITLVQGIMAIIGGLGIGLGTMCIYFPFVYGIVFGIMATIKGSAMLGQNPWPAYQTVRTTAIMGIVNVINCDFMFGMAGGIVILVFLNDPEVKAYIYSKGGQI